MERLLEWFGLALVKRVTEDQEAIMESVDRKLDLHHQQILRLRTAICQVASDDRAKHLVGNDTRKVLHTDKFPNPAEG